MSRRAPSSEVEHHADMPLEQGYALGDSLLKVKPYYRAHDVRVLALVTIGTAASQILILPRGPRSLKKFTIVATHVG